MPATPVRGTPQAARTPAMSLTPGSAEEERLQLARETMVREVAEDEATHLTALDTASPSARTVSMVQQKRMFETYLVVGAKTEIREPLEELLSRWSTRSGTEDNLRKLAQEQARPELITLYPVVQ